MKKTLLFWLFCALSLCTTPAIARDWYVSTLTGNDTTGTGAIGAPLASVGEVVTRRAAGTLTLAAGDRLLLEGTFRESPTLSGLDGVTIEAWGTGYQFRGAFLCSNWTSIGSNTYTMSLVDKAVVGVVVDWDASRTTNGLHYGHLTNAASALLVQSTANSWHYSATTDLLTVNLNGDNPASKVVEWCVANVNGLNLGSATNCVVDDFNAALYMDPDAGQGYGFIAYGTGNTLRIDRIDDSGYHHVGYVGGACSYNIIEPARGGEGICAGVNTGGIPLVFYTTSASQVGNEARNIRIFATPLLKRDQTALHSGSIGGVYAHTNASGDGAPKFDGVTWRRIHVTYPISVNVGSTPFTFAQSTAPTAAGLDRDDPDSYGIKFIECRVDGAYAPGLTFGPAGSAAFVRCSLRFAETTKNQSPTAVINAYTSDAHRKQVLFDACEIIMDLDGASTGRGIKNWSNNDFLFVNCSILDIGTGSNARLIFETSYIAANPNHTACFYGRQSIFGFHSTTAATRYVLFGDSLTSNLASANANNVIPRDFVDCSAVRKTLMSTNVNYDAEGEWTGAVDASARYEATSPFQSPAYHLRLAPSHALYTHRDTSSTSHTLLGINFKPWTGTLGAYQLNTSAQAYATALTSPPRKVTRPAYYIECFTGSHTNNPYGINPALVSDPATFFTTYLDIAHASGYTHVIIHVPEGTTSGDVYYQLLGTPSCAPNVADYIINDLARECAARDIVEVTFYTGAVWRTNATTGQPPLPDPELEDVELDDTLLAARTAGFTSVFFDAVANRGNDDNGNSVATDFAELSGYVSDYLGFATGGEALPLNGGQDDFDSTYIGMGSWLVLEALLETLTDVEDQDLTAGAAVHVIFTDPVDREAAQRRIDQGYIVGVDNSVTDADALWVLQQQTNPVTNTPPTFNWRRGLNYRLPGRRRIGKKPPRGSRRFFASA